MQAYAAAKFGEACLRALQGETGIVECAYVASEVGNHIEVSSLVWECFSVVLYIIVILQVHLKNFQLCQVLNCLL